MGKAAIPAAISAAGSIAGGAMSMGGKGGRGSISSNLLMDEQRSNAILARQLATESANRARPLQNATAGVFNDFLSSGQTPSFLDLPNITPLASLSLPALGNQQTLLRQQMVNQGIRGGQLQQNLANLTLQGGLQRTGLLQQDALRQDALNQQRAALRQSLFGAAADFGNGGTAQALQGIGQSTAGFNSALQGSLGLQQLQQQRDIMSSLGAGQLLGKGLSTGLGFLPSSALQGTVMGSKLKV